MLELWRTLPNLSIDCPHSSTSTKYYPFTEGDKNLLSKVRDNMVGGPSIVFTRKGVVDETHIHKPTNICKSIVGIGASQLYCYSMCQPLPTRQYSRNEFDADLQRVKPGQNKSRSFEILVLSYFQRIRQNCRIENFYTTGFQKKIDCFNTVGFCAHCNTVFEAMGCFYQYCPCQEARPALTEKDIQRGTKKRELDEMWRQCIQEKGYTVVKMWECEWSKLYNTGVSVKEHLRESFPYKLPLRQDHLLDKIKSGALFGHAQCDIEVPEQLREKLATFSPNFKKTNV